MKIEEAAQRFNWFKIGSDGVPELYADHQMLSTLRLCEGAFMLKHIHNVNPKGRAWSLEFGKWFHRQMEYFYEAEKSGGANGSHINLTEWLQKATADWSVYRLEEFKLDKRYQSLKGLGGALALLSHYWFFFGEGAERLRVVATEIAFGGAKEVPILNDHTLYSYAPFRAYLTGRIDLLMDDGTRIGPLDHKTARSFTGKDHVHFNPQEGVTGYILSVRSLMKSLYPELEAQGRLCDSLWINHVSLTNCDNRFKRSRITKSVEQLEEYKRRQIGTFTKLWDLVIRERPADWNAQVCDNIFHHECEFKALHERPNSEQELIFPGHYTIGEPWNPYQND